MGTDAANAVALMRPTPGMAASRWLAVSCWCQASSRRLKGMDLQRHSIELSRQQQQGGSGNVWQHRGVRFSDLGDKVFGLSRALRYDHPELGAVTADGVDQRGPLANQKFPGPVQDKDRLSFCALDRHEPHGRPTHGFAYGFCVGGVVLLSAEISLYIGWRHERDLMAQGRDLAGPIVSRGAGLHPDETGGQLLEGVDQFASPQLLAHNNRA